MDNKIKNILICGLGAIGSIYADKINANRPDSLRILVDSSRLERYVSSPLIFNGKELHLNYILPNASDFKADLIIIATKNDGLLDVLKDIKNFVKHDTVILSLLNGVTSEDLIAESFGWERVLLAFFIGHSAIRYSRNVLHDGVNAIYFGEKFSTGEYSDKMARLKDFFDEMGINYVIPADIYYSQWQKFMLNIVANQSSAIFKMTFGDMQKNEPFQNFALNIMKEVECIAKAEGVKHSENLIADTVKSFDKMLPEGKTSMLQDIEAGRNTEVDIFAGTIINLGIKHGIPTPYNSIMMEMIKVIQANNDLRNSEIQSVS